MPKKWTKKDIPDLANKTIIVTGGNTGLGKASVSIFSQKNADVTLACRDFNKGNQAKNDILEMFPSSKIQVMELDLADLDSIRRFAENFKKTHHRLDVLLNNAGVMMCENCKTKDDFEMQIGTNHLGHFALTGLLFDVLKKTPNSRVVNISSLGHKLFGTFDPDNFMFENGGYTPSLAYGRSKLCNLLFTFRLQRRIDESRLDILSVAAHPGGVYTNLGKHLPKTNPILGWLMSLGIVIQSPEMGALPGIRASVDPKTKSGDYIGPSGFFEIRGNPKFVKPSKASLNLEHSKWLWEISEKLTGIRFNFKKLL